MLASRADLPIDRTAVWELNVQIHSLLALTRSSTT
jgi:hypothetical protein